jgi:hypothetical protein
MFWCELRNVKVYSMQCTALSSRYGVHVTTEIRPTSSTQIVWIVACFFYTMLRYDAGLPNRNVKVCMLWDFKISLEPNFIQNQRLEQYFWKSQGRWCKVMRFFLKFWFIFIWEMTWIECRNYRPWLTLDSRWTYNSKKSSKFERVAVVMHGSLS